MKHSWPVVLIAALLSGTTVYADPADCQLDAIRHEFDWSREFQGVAEPISWKISREVKFRPTQREGRYVVDESLSLQLPDFRRKFSTYLGSAILDSCELRFRADAKVLTAHGSEIRLPFVVDYEEATCKNRLRMCRQGGIEFHVCEKQKRKIKKSDGAEIDVRYSVRLQEPDLESVVSWEQSPYYGELQLAQARSLFEQVLDDGGAALAFITGTLGQVSLTRLSDKINAFQVSSEFTSYDATSYQADASYRVSSEQACTLREQLLRQAEKPKSSAAP